MADADPDPPEKDEPTLPTSEQVEEALQAVVHGPTFGPPFFQHQLAELVSQQSAGGLLPRVRIHLHGGDVLEVTRIMGLTPRWLAVTVHDDEDGAPEGATRTEVIPYTLVARVTVTATPPDEERARIGFRQEARPAVIASGGTTDSK